MSTHSSTSPVHHAKLPACANCAYTFAEVGPNEFCPQCGQQNHEVNLSFGHLAEETLEGLFHFDGKVFRTAKLLLFRPGVLTRQFLEGKQMPYVPPVRLYVFLSFVFFFLFSVLNKPEHGRQRSIQQLSRQVAAAQLHDSSRRVAQQVGQDLPLLSPAQRTQVRRQLADSLRQRRTARRPPAADSIQVGKGFRVTVMGLDLTAADVQRLPADPTEAQVDSVIRSKSKPLTFMNRMAVKRAVRWRDVTQEDGFHQVLRGLSFLIFLIMPLAALLLKGVYFRQRRYYVGHLIFTVHVHCFLLVYFTVALLLSKISFMAWAEDWLVLVPAIYFVVALHNFYQQSWPITLLKSVVLSVAYSFTLTLAGVLVGLVGLFLF